MITRCQECAGTGKWHDEPCAACDGTGNVADETEETCVVCDGPLVPLGALGRTRHYRCRDCGIESYRKGEP